MKKYVSLLKGLYWYFRYSNRIVIPLTVEGWKMLRTCAGMWKDGYPEEVQFGMYVAIEHQAMMEEATMTTAQELIDYHYKRTCQYLGLYSVFPIGPRTTVQYNHEYLLYTNIGWKNNFEWRPVC